MLNRILLSTLMLTTSGQLLAAEYCPPARNNMVYVDGTENDDNIYYGKYTAVVRDRRGNLIDTFTKSATQSWRINAREGDDLVQELWSDRDDSNMVQICGHWGNDSIYGSRTPFNDSLQGDAHDDHIVGHGSGYDRLSGGQGNDTLSNSGQTGSYFHGGTGNDTMDGNTTNSSSGNYMLGDYGNDTIYGSKGNDKIYGGRGNDTLHGRRGNDLIKGHNGNDLLLGGPGNDKLYGQSGDDALDGGSGTDRASGGSGGYDSCSAETMISCEDEQ